MIADLFSFQKNVDDLFFFFESIFLTVNYFVSSNSRNLFFGLHLLSKVSLIVSNFSPELNFFDCCLAHEKKNVGFDRLAPLILYM
jgi:hypothetical protein